MGRNYVRRDNATKYIEVFAVERRICCFWMVPNELSSFSLCSFLEISSFQFWDSLSSSYLGLLPCACFETSI